MFSGLLRALRRPPSAGAGSARSGPLPLRIPDASGVLDRVEAALAAPGSAPVELARRASALVLRARVGGDWEAVAPEVEALLDLLSRSTPRRDRPAAAEIVARTTGIAFAWPAFPGSRRAWAHGLATLSRAGAERARPDGTPPDGDALALLAWLEAVLLLAQDARAEGVALPSPLVRAAASAASHLWVRGAPHGTYPDGAAGPLLGPPGRVIASARNATIALGWASGDPAPVHDGGALSRALGGLPAAPAALPGDEDWSMWAWADGAIAVLHARGKRPARIVVDAGCPQPIGGFPGFELEVDGVAVLRREGHAWAGASGRPRLEAARVDVSTGRSPRRGRVVVAGDALVREIVARQARVVVEDTPAAPGPVRVRWAFAPGWRLAPDATPPTATRDAGRPLRLDLDARLAWRVEREAGGEALVGSGEHTEGADPVRVGFEWT